MPRLTSMKLKPNARWRCSDGTMRESNVLLGPQPAPPKSASNSAATWPARLSVWACAQRINDAASATTATMMTRTGPNQSVNVPHNGTAANADERGRRKSSVAKSVENPRTLWR